MSAQAQPRTSVCCMKHPQDDEITQKRLLFGWQFEGGARPRGGLDVPDCLFSILPLFRERRVPCSIALSHPPTAVASLLRPLVALQPPRPSLPDAEVVWCLFVCCFVSLSKTALLLPALQITCLHSVNPPPPPTNHATPHHTTPHRAGGPPQCPNPNLLPASRASAWPFPCSAGQLLDSDRHACHGQRASPRFAPHGTPPASTANLRPPTSANRSPRRALCCSSACRASAAAGKARSHRRRSGAGWSAAGAGASHRRQPSAPKLPA